VSSNAFRGIGRTVPPAMINTVCNIIRVPLAYVLSADFTGLGLVGVWIGITVVMCMKGIWSYSWYLLTKRKPALDEKSGVSS